MGYATYTAKRSLANSHAIDVAYTIPLSLQDLVFAGADLKVPQKSLSGKVETLFFGQEKIYRVILEPILDAESAAVREFIDSTADGHTFVFDPHGLPGQPVRELTVIREDSGATESIRLRDGIDAWVQFEFEIRVQ